MKNLIGQVNFMKAHESKQVRDLLLPTFSGFMVVKELSILTEDDHNENTVDHTLLAKKAEYNKKYVK